jgi:hypothetical protein
MSAVTGIGSAACDGCRSLEREKERCDERAVTPMRILVVVEVAVRRSVHPRSPVQKCDKAD